MGDCNHVESGTRTVVPSLSLIRALRAGSTCAYTRPTTIRMSFSVSMQDLLDIATLMLEMRFSISLLVAPRTIDSKRMSIFKPYRSARRPINARILKSMPGGNIYNLTHLSFKWKMYSCQPFKKILYQTSYWGWCLWSSSRLGTYAKGYPIATANGTGRMVS